MIDITLAATNQKESISLPIRRDLLDAKLTNERASSVISDHWPLTDNKPTSVAAVNRACTHTLQRHLSLQLSVPECDVIEPGVRWTTHFDVNWKHFLTFYVWTQARRAVAIQTCSLPAVRRNSTNTSSMPFRLYATPPKIVTLAVTSSQFRPSDIWRRNVVSGGMNWLQVKLLVLWKNGLFDPNAIWVSEWRGLKESCIGWVCTLAPPRKYSWTIVPWLWVGLPSGMATRCGLLPNYLRCATKATVWHCLQHWQVSVSRRTCCKQKRPLSVIKLEFHGTDTYTDTDIRDAPVV